MNARQRRTHRRAERRRWGREYARTFSTYELLRLCRETGTLEVTPNPDGTYDVVGTCKVVVPTRWNAPLQVRLTLT